MLKILVVYAVTTVFFYCTSTIIYQTGVDSDKKPLKNTLDNFNGASNIATTNTASFAIKDGAIYVLWGSGNNVLGLEKINQIQQPTIINKIKTHDNKDLIWQDGAYRNQNSTAIKFKDIKGGADHVMALTDDGKIFVWGENNNGQLGLSGQELSTEQNATHTKIAVNIPTESWFFSAKQLNVLSIHVNDNNSGAIIRSFNSQDKVVFLWGNNSHCQLGRGKTAEEINHNDTPMPALFANNTIVSNITNIELARQAIIMKNNNGLFFGAGDISYGLLGCNYAKQSDTTNNSWYKGDNKQGIESLKFATELSNLKPGEIESFKAGYNHIGILSKNQLKTLGDNEKNQLGYYTAQQELFGSSGNKKPFTCSFGDTPIQTITDYYLSCDKTFVITQGNMVYGFGDNTDNAFGFKNPTNNQLNIIANFSEKGNVLNIVAQKNHILALIKPEDTKGDLGKNHCEIQQQMNGNLVKNLQDQIKNLEEQNELFDTTYKKQCCAINQTKQNELNSIKEKIDNLSKQLIQKQKELDALNEQLIKQKTEHAQTLDAQKKASSEKIQALQKTIDKLTKEDTNAPNVLIQKLESEIKTLTDQRDQDTKEFNQKIINNNESYEKKINELNQQIIEKNKDFEEKEKQLIDAKKSCENSQKEFCDSMKGIDDLKQQENQYLKKQIETLNNKITDNEKNLNDCNQNKQNDQQQINNIETICNQKSSESKTEILRLQSLLEKSPDKQTLAIKTTANKISLLPGETAKITLIATISSSRNPMTSIDLKKWLLNKISKDQNGKYVAKDQQNQIIGTFNKITIKQQKNNLIEMDLDFTKDKNYKKSPCVIAIEINGKLFTICSFTN